MTLSKTDRVSNMTDALKLLLERVGDRAIYTDEVLDDDPAVAGIHSTTWKELIARRLVKARYGIKWCRYQLTGDGWLKAIKISGQLEAPEFQARFARLNAALKGYIKGRREEGFEQIHAVAAKASVSAEWLYNILESRIWTREFNRTGAELDDSQKMVVIPIDFGMDRL